MRCRDFYDTLKQLLLFCGYQTSSFKCHSFRIGAATDVALRVKGTNWFDLQRTSTVGRSAQYVYILSIVNIKFHDFP